MASRRWDLASTSGSQRTRVDTATQFRKCGDKKCGITIFVKDIERNHFCCTSCGFHFRIGATERIKQTFDPGTWSELFANLEPVDTLKFKATKSYEDSIQRSQKKTGFKEGVVCGTAKLDGVKVASSVMEFGFIGGSMGSVVGEKITRTIEYGTKHKLPVIVFCCSGGARMQEGVLSLMQMAKTSAAIQRHNEACLPYITVLTDPTLAGVSASFAFLADVIIGEPRAMIGFTGARVIQDTIRKKLPPGFQESEFLLKHGQIDKVVQRKDMRETLAQILWYSNGKLTTPRKSTKIKEEPASPAKATKVKPKTAKTSKAPTTKTRKSTAKTKPTTKKKKVASKPKKKSAPKKKVAKKAKKSKQKK